MIVIDVLGTPAPKGSSRAILIRGRAVNVPGGSNVGRTKMKVWERVVRERVLEQVFENRAPRAPLFIDTPLAVALMFRLARPSKHYRTGKHAGELRPDAPLVPATKPDADKIARSTLDALTGGIYDDDSRIVELVVFKQFALPGEEGARIVIKRWSPT